MGDIEREKEKGGEERSLSVEFLTVGIEWPQLKTEDEDILAKEMKELLEKLRERVILTSWFLINLRIIDQAWWFC